MSKMPVLEFFAAISQAQAKLMADTGKAPENIIIELNTELFYHAQESMASTSLYPDRYRGVETIQFYCPCGATIHIQHKPHKCNCEYCNKK